MENLVFVGRIQIWDDDAASPGETGRRPGLSGSGDKSHSLAEAQLKHRETAEMYLYAGMADSLQARLYRLRWENRATARAGVRARENYERALALDPSLADADMGLGLYNYYVDTLSTIARILRFFMGIREGRKRRGYAGYSGRFARAS